MAARLKEANQTTLEVPHHEDESDIGVGGCVASVVALVAASAFGQILTASCLHPTSPSVVEEARLPNTLPDNANPAILQTKSFAQQMIEGAGFQDFGPAFVNDLCGIPKFSVALKLAASQRRRAVHMAIDRAQQRVATLGNLPYSDDRPLYWARLRCAPRSANGCRSSTCRLPTVSI